MLTHLQIRNFTIITQLDLAFHAGMTVITGETGAGKSIIVDAVTLLFGGRANSQLIRPNCDRCDITGLFAIENNPALQTWLNDKNLANDNSEECLIKRSLSQDGRSRAFINGQLASIQLLRELANHLIEIHGQHEYQRLFKHDTQRMIVDSYGKHQSLVKQVYTHYQQWHDVHKTITTLENQSHDHHARIDLLRYQLHELEQLAITDNEIDHLHKEYHLLSHAQESITTNQQIMDLLSEQDSSVHNHAQLALTLLEKQSQRHPELKNALTMLKSASIQIEESSHEIQLFLQNINEDPARLQWIEQRLQNLHDVARKHRIEPEALSQLTLRLQQELDQLEHSDEHLATLQQQLTEHAENYQQAAQQLSQKRRASAKKLSRLVTKNIHLLSMEQGTFDIQCLPHDENTLTPYGLERIEYMVNTNPGQAPAPMSKIASGGELSRISLALQVIIARHYQTPIIIFDEVDVGISGATAEVVGQLLQQLGQNTQILCITHLPQVAAQANQHLLVSKTTDKKTTQTTLTTLAQQQRIEELARMLGGRQITKQTLAHAEEMLCGISEGH